jgi:hypothetical protein
MAIRFNYTRRVELPDNVLSSKIVINQQQPSSFTLDLNWDISYLETKQQFEIIFLVKSLGETIRKGTGPGLPNKGTLSIDLQSMRNPLNSIVKMKVIKIDSRNIPLVIATLDEHQPILPNNIKPRKSLLRTKIDRTLEVPWKMSFEDGIPTLCVTNKFELYEPFAIGSPIFDATILPEVIRQVMLWIKYPQEEKDTRYVEGWKTVLEVLGCQRDYLDEELIFADINEMDVVDLNRRAESAGAVFSNNYDSLGRLVSALVDNS